MGGGEGGGHERGAKSDPQRIPGPTRHSRGGAAAATPARTGAGAPGGAPGLGLLLLRAGSRPRTATPREAELARWAGGERRGRCVTGDRGRRCPAKPCGEKAPPPKRGSGFHHGRVPQDHLRSCGVLEEGEILRLRAAIYLLIAPTRRRSREGAAALGMLYCAAYPAMNFIRMAFQYTLPARPAADARTRRGRATVGGTPTHRDTAVVPPSRKGAGELLDYDRGRFLSVAFAEE